ncbi:MAG TPA: thioesterase family protein [Microthrixaceae bacterium]|nr:thioesterase family protein [Microthrixaceae bacterium]HNH37176.1 thioesterase family protein [Microthrixaceae bacterium]
MDAAEFLGLEPTHNPSRWYLPVTEGIITGGNFLFGGCGLGAAVAAMERVCDRPLVWATAQYLSFATTGEIMDLDVTVAVSGRHTAQARAVGHVGDREILTVNAALGSRDLPVDGQWAVMPSVPEPEDCPVRAPRFGLERSIMTRLDVRIAVGSGWDALDGNPVPDGRSALWVRVPDVEMSAAALSILGDYVPFGISQSLGGWYPGNSLDNTLRVVRLEPSEWVLIDVRIDGLHSGFGHGSVHLWNQAGTLLATASQSTVVRNRRLD